MYIFGSSGIKERERILEATLSARGAHADAEDEEDEVPPKLNVSEEVGTIEVEDLDKPQTVELPVSEEVDPLKEIESKVTEGESLVLNL